MNKVILILFAGSVMVACKPDPEPVVIVDDSDGITDEGQGELMYEIDWDEMVEEVYDPKRPVYREAETILTDLVHTKLEVNFDWAKSRMNGVATITAKPHFYASDSLILDAKGMDINSVKMDGKDLKYTYKDDFLRINLGKEYTRNDKYTVVIDYVAKPDERETGGSAAITSDKGLYFINPTGEDPDKMPQIWTQGETEASSVWFPTIDAPNAKTTQEIFITVDDKYITLSNGKMVSSKKIDGGKRIDHWKQDKPHAPYLFMMGVGEFKIVKDSYTRPDGSKMEVNYYVEPEWEPYAKAIFGETPEMIKFFSKRLGVDYAWDKYNQIVVRDYVSGAMENTGAVIFGDFVYKNDRELLDGNDQSTIAHELFHHWFGDLVTCESWSNLPLNESFANYSQYLWDEYRFGLDEADYNAENEMGGYMQSAQYQGHHNLIWFDYDDKEQMFDGHSYNKGGRILHMLRQHLGDDAFFEALRRYLTDNKFKAAEFHQLRLAFEEVSGQDLNWFFNQWFLASGHAELFFDHEMNATGDSVTIIVNQNQDLDEVPIYKIPLEVAIWDNNGKNVHRVIIDEVMEEFTLPIKDTLLGIVYDNQQMLLANVEQNKSKEQYLFQYYNSDRFYDRRDGLMNGYKVKGDPGQQLILDAMNDKFWKIRELAIDRSKKLKGDFESKGIEKLKDLAANDPDSRVREAALGALGNELEDDMETLKPILVDRIENDKSYTVITSALIEYGNIDPEGAVAKAEAFENEKSSAMISGICGLYSKFSGEEKFDYITGVLNGNVVGGWDKFGLVSSYTYYLTRIDVEYAEKAIGVFEDQLENGGYYMSLFLPRSIEYLLRDFDTKRAELEVELAKYEENNDAAYADQTRKKIAKCNEVSELYLALLTKIEEGSGGAHIIVEEE